MNGYNAEMESEKVVYVANSITYGDIAIIVLLIIIVVCLLAIVSNTGQKSFTVAPAKEKRDDLEP